jgi:hypothetical protein
MRVNYIFPVLSRAERERLESVLLEELQIQGWYSVVYSSIFGGELILAIQ